MTTMPSIGTVCSTTRMASTAAPSAPFLSPRPIQREAARAAASVTRTSSSAKFRSGTCLSGAMRAILRGMTKRQDWERAFEESQLRDAEFATMSALPVEPVYGPDDGEFPGQYPFTRGPYASMYRSKMWTMRMFAGFGTAIDTNQRFRDILAAGGDGLSTAFDLPTLMGRDSDDPLGEGEVGKCGVAVDTLADMEDLFAAIDLGQVTTSMTINSPAAVLLAMYVAVAEKSGVARARLGGTLQNDILKEFHAQKEFVFPPKPSMRLRRDSIPVCAAERAPLPPVSVVGFPL